LAFDRNLIFLTAPAGSHVLMIFQAAEMITLKMLFVVVVLKSAASTFILNSKNKVYSYKNQNRLNVY
jgi:hypothetical protein